MKEILVSLAKLLATDDAFNLAFSSLTTDEGKYELARTKFTDLTRDDFSAFLEELHDSEKASLAELSTDELAKVAGGAGGLATKLAAAAMLVTVFGGSSVLAHTADAAKRKPKPKLGDVVRKCGSSLSTGSPDSELTALSLLEKVAGAYGDYAAGHRADENTSDACDHARGVLGVCTREAWRNGQMQKPGVSFVETALRAGLLRLRKGVTYQGVPVTFDDVVDAIVWMLGNRERASPTLADGESVLSDREMAFLADEHTRAARSHWRTCEEVPPSDGPARFRLTLSNERLGQPRDIVVTPERFQHICVGGVEHGKVNYGHTKFAESFAHSVAVMRDQLMQSETLRRFYTLLVGVEPSVCQRPVVDTHAAGRTTDFVTDAGTMRKCIFPDSWTWDDIMQAAKRCLSNGAMEKGDNNYWVYTLRMRATENTREFTLRTVFNPADNHLISCYPIYD